MPAGCLIHLPIVFFSFVTKVDFWRGPARPSLPVDMRVPFSELKDIKAYLESHGLAYNIMIKDIQVRSCPNTEVGGSHLHIPCRFGPNLEKKYPRLKWMFSFWSFICIFVNLPGKEWNLTLVKENLNLRKIFLKNLNVRKIQERVHNSQVRVACGVLFKEKKFF